MSLKSISIKPTTTQSPTGIIVMLHGWGANCYDLEPLAEALNLPEYQFEFLDAPFPHPQVPGGKMWYDLESDNYEGLEESRQQVMDWLGELEQDTGVPLSRTILSGFSQGGATILDVGLRLPVAALVSMSGYLHCEPEPTGDRLPPSLIMHGIQDPVVPIAAAHQVRDLFQALGMSVQYREFTMNHAICPEEIALFHQFVRGLNLGEV
ncbi:alpha/beta hydrolase [Oxynema aestuarii]|uniref:Alpha/beta hydrolase n=1 Tax=Oxynema aestuarii AP17 TaxID=2064643 RepID=A0A6H1TYY9_9CYAN|nr:alpha/beta hydrolase [Oxynema aestuarii]QIZ70579.1 alpha/beta hydrolase [Oxynema aestuarii AP17]RMH75852.1 MAG: alpha/beta hydrolase [Cyanobacteria bacterium J007]